MCSVGEMLKLTCVILYLKVGINLIGESRVISSSSKGYLFMQKSAINNWSCSFVLQFSVYIRVSNLIELQIKDFKGFYVSAIKSSFCSVNVLCWSVRLGLEALCSLNVAVLCCGILCVYSIRLCFKIIPKGSLSMIRGLLATR